MVCICFGVIVARCDFLWKTVTEFCIFTVPFFIEAYICIFKLLVNLVPIFSIALYSTMREYWAKKLHYSQYPENGQRTEIGTNSMILPDK